MNKEQNDDTVPCRICEEPMPDALQEQGLAVVLNRDIPDERIFICDTCVRRIMVAAELMS